MNTFNNQSDYLEGYENPGSGARGAENTRREKDIPQDENLPAALPPQEDDSLPVLLRPADRRAEAFLPEWLRRLARG